MGGETVRVCLVLLVIFASPVTFAALTPSETFSGSISLVKDDIYHLFWKSDNTSITFEVHAKVKGWIGFGLSPTGGMAYSDIVIGWIKNGVPQFKDRWTTQKAMPTVDDSQDWILLAANETDTHTIFKFKRPLYSCDPRDRNVTQDTTHIIFAYSNTVPSSDNDVHYHGATRGSKSISLLALHEDTPNLPPDIVHYDVVNDNTSIPHTSDTTYWCSGHYPPALSHKHHLVKVSPVIQPGNEALVHHIVLYACYHMPHVKDNITKGAICGTPNMPWEECGTIVAVWAVGGGDFVLPDHVGFPLGGEEGSIQYLMLQIHYDNPTFRQGAVDSSGMRLWFTPTLRSIDASAFAAGLPVRHGIHIIPAGYPDLLSVGYCTEECLTQAMGNTSEIKVFAILLHTHLIGIGVKVRHFRDGVELPYLDSDAHYDFNYQQSRYMNPPVTIKKGDNLRVECLYNSKYRNVTTFGGHATTDEMCLAFIYYYPKIPLAWCMSGPTESQMANGLNLKYRLNDKGNAILTEGPYANRSFDEYITNVRFSDATTMDNYQKAVTSGEMIQNCGSGLGYVHPAELTTFDTPEVGTPYTPESPPCGSLDGLTDVGRESSSTPDSQTTPPGGRAPTATSLGVLRLLLIGFVSRMYFRLYSTV